MTKSRLSWRQAKASDLPDIASVGNRIHDGLHEQPEVFAEKFRLFPEGCFVLESEGELAGYGLSHPWRLHQIPPLNALLESLPHAPQCLYLHDVVVLPQARGRGAVAALVEALVEVANKHGLQRLALVSVHNTKAFWARFGFAPVDDDSLAGKLQSYGEVAVYMVRRLR